MDTQIWVAIFTVILLGVILVFYFSPSYAPKILVAAPGPYSLDKMTTIIDQKESTPFYSESNGSFSCFVYLNPLNRTGAYAACGTNPNQASCDDGSFPPCACNAATGDCSVCSHAGYSMVFNISGIVSLEVLVAPDASRQGQAMAQLIVKTEGLAVTPTATPLTPIQSSTSQKYIETLSLPPIPLQKWTFVTVAREGRRFDVYFNDSIVISQKTMNMPISNVTGSNMGGITSGSNGLAGHLALGNLYNYRLSSLDVANKYAEYADTRGRPYLNTTTNPLTLSDAGGLVPTYSASLSTGLSSYIPSMSLCPSGGCLNPPTIRPASPLCDWSNSYQ